MADLRCYNCKAPIRLHSQVCSNCEKVAVLLERYALTAILGKGGHGFVYDALDVVEGRRCAVKEVQRDAGNIERIDDEIQMLVASAELGLDFIPKIYDYLRESARYFIVMEYIEGQTLNQIVPHRWRAAEVNTFLRTLLEYLVQLDAAGIVHRDIKPLNIKRTPQGRYKLLDFGISKRMTDGSSFKAHTLEYAPIEQISSLGTDKRSDLFSLAVTAYELLVGELPPNAVARGRGEPLPRPSQWLPNIPAALEEVLLWMLELEPDHRPPDARAALALLPEEVEDHSPPPQPDVPLLDDNRPTSRPQKHRQGKGRITGMTPAPDGQMLAVTSTMGVYLYDTQTLAERHFVETDRPAQQVTFMQGGQHLVIVQGAQARIWSIAGTQPARTLPGLPPHTAQVAFSPDDQMFAMAADTELWVERIGDGRPLYTLDPATDMWGSLLFAPDGTILAAAAGRTVRLWRASDGQLLHTLPKHSAQVSCLAFSAHSQVFATGGGEGVQIWRVSDGRLLHSLSTHGTRVTSLAFAPDGQTLAVGIDTRIQLWQVSDGVGLRALEGHRSPVLSVAFAGSTQILVSASGETVRVWRTTDGAAVRALAEHMNRLHSVAFSPDGRLLATMGGVVQLWQVGEGILRLLQTFSWHTDEDNSVAFAPDGELLATASSAGITLWRLSDDQLAQTIAGRPAQTNSMAFSPDGQALAVVAEDSVEVWSANDGTHHCSLPYGEAYDVALSADGQMVATLTDDAIQIWRVRDQQIVYTLDTTRLAALGVDQDITSITLAPNGNALAIASPEAVSIWSISEDSLLHRIEAGAERVVFAADGTALALIRGSAIELRRAGDGELKKIRTLNEHKDQVSDVAFAPGGRILASVSHDGTIWLCQV